MSTKHWNQERIVDELKHVISAIGYFPTSTYLRSINRLDLEYAISLYGGYVKFRRLMGYEFLYKPDNYWNGDTIIKEINNIIQITNEFPTSTYLRSIKRDDLYSAIIKHGGIKRLRKLMGYNLLKGSYEKWTDDIVVSEVKEIIKTKGAFPTQSKLRKEGRNDLLGAIDRRGGLNKYRKIFGYQLIQKPNGYWTDETIIEELKNIIKIKGVFPTTTDLKNIGRKDIDAAIYMNGGICKYRKILGYSTEFTEYISQLMSYINRRGKNSEKIVFDILNKYCRLYKLSLPKKNIKLCDKNIIEFVCTNKKVIGIDVTNTESKACITKKWKHKNYYKYLDELWIVIVSDSFIEEDYINWNKSSPNNVYIYSIDAFIEELQIDLDETIKSKIYRYKKCSFHTKEQFKKEKYSSYIQ